MMVAQGFVALRWFIDCISSADPTAGMKDYGGSDFEAAVGLVAPFDTPVFPLVDEDGKLTFFVGL